MTLATTSPVTGAAQTGFTSPTYTLTADIAPAPNGKQYAVTAVGGTQVGVTTHSVSVPFTLTWWRQLLLKTLPSANPLTGVIKNIPMNTTKFVVRKGLIPAVNQNPIIGSVTVQVSVPAGAETYDSANMRALLSLAIGALNQNSAGLGDTVNSGIS